MRLFIPNLTFEDDLLRPAASRSKGTLSAVNDLAPIMGLLGNSGDAVLVDTAPAQEELPSHLSHVRFVEDIESIDGPVEVVPFGWTDGCRQMAANCGTLPKVIPSDAVVQRVNSREFNAEHDFFMLDSDTDLSMPFCQRFGMVCRSLTEWEASIQAMSLAGFEEWVAKPAISHAGRNRLLATGTHLNEQQTGWLKRTLALSGYVYVEPWVPVLKEWGLQFDVGASQKDDVKFLGFTKLINDSAGRYLGCIVTKPSSYLQPPDAAVRHGMSVCRAAKAEGYIGPIGIDCFEFSLPNGHIGMRFCNDINARFTMGRIALHFAPRIDSEELALWGQFRASDFYRNLRSTGDSSGSCRIRDVIISVTSPKSIQSRPVRTLTALLVGRSETAIHQVRKSLMGIR